jgi:hypothetical protein
MPVVSLPIDRRLREAAVALDDPRESMAETWRRVGRVADELGLTRPGYDSIRLIVGERRRASREIAARLQPVLSDLLQGRLSAWDLQQLIDAASIHAFTRAP